MSTTSSGPDPTPKKWQLLLLLRRPRRRAFPSFFYFFPKRLQQLKEKTFLILFVLTIGLASLFGLPAAAAAFLAADDRCINKNSFLFLFRFSVKNDKRWCSSLLPICFDRNLFQHPRLSRFRIDWQSRTSRFSRRRRVERGYSFSHLTIKSWSEKCHVATFKCFFPPQDFEDLTFPPQEDSWHLIRVRVRVDVIVVTVVVGVENNFFRSTQDGQARAGLDHRASQRAHILW